MKKEMTIVIETLLLKYKNKLEISKWIKKMKFKLLNKIVNESDKIPGRKKFINSNQFLSRKKLISLYYK